MEANIIFVLLNLAMLIVSSYQAWKRSKFQNVVDDSSAAINFQSLVVKLQSEVEELKNWKEHAQLEIGLHIKMGEKPEIISWKWSTQIMDEKA